MTTWHRAPNRYAQVLTAVFQHHYKPGMTVVPFTRQDLKDHAAKNDIPSIDNWGDSLYAFRFRTDLPEPILKTAPKGKEWAIFLAGRSMYEFRVVNRARFTPTPGLRVTKIPDATPELVRSAALTDEQALLAVVRYNRLIDLFLGANSFALQSHLRTTAEGIGQTEIDEVYVAVDKYGVQYVVPVQAKGGSDQIGVVQVVQDLAVCREKFEDYVPRPIATQFRDDSTVAMFEFAEDGDEIVIVNEKHYRLVAASEITSQDLKAYQRAANSES